MAVLISGKVSPPGNISFSTGAEPPCPAGKMGEIMFSPLHGSLYTQTYNGRMFHGFTGTPAAIPIYSATSVGLILFNPKSSGVHCILVHYCAGWVSGTNVEGNISLGILTSAPGAIASGTAITAFTDGTVINGNPVAGNASRVRFGSAATLGAAATQFLPLGISNMKLAASNSSSFNIFFDFGGTFIVGPGCAVFSCASAATTALYNERLCWYEFPS
jgi:hypothetical protein